MRVIAHRGDVRSGHVENTLGAVRAAFARGADGVEVDLRLSEDGVLVACHDPHLRRGVGFEISSWPWETLRTAALPLQLARAEDLLACAAHRALVLELKPTADVERTAEALGAALDAVGPLRDITVSSFDSRLMASVRRLAAGHPAVTTALLGAPGTPAWRTLGRAVEAGHGQVHPHWRDLMSDPGTLERAEDLGLEVVPWTVNRLAELRRCAQLGVAAVITDDVTAARRAALRAGRAA